jgi:hypothetical protein
MPIPFDPTCMAFKSALDESGIRNDLSMLDVRLGLEQILDDVDYRAEAEERWAGPNPATIELGPDSALEKFKLVSPRHAELTVENIRVGLEAVVDTPDFMTEARARWARFDVAPWDPNPEPETSLVVVDDLGADDSEGEV